MAGSLRCSLCIGFTSSLLLVFAASAEAQFAPPSTGGVTALVHELRMLGHYKRVLMIGAHPDDEDTELLALLVRGAGAEAAYLSLNRGEGGQNLIGQERALLRVPERERTPEQRDRLRGIGAELDRAFERLRRRAAGTET